MSDVDDYLDRLGASLRVRGRQRRRILEECREHLEQAAAERGEQAAIAAFGAPREIARDCDAEAAARRGVLAGGATVLAVLVTAGSTLALIDAAQQGASGAAPVAIAFFVLAQVAAVATALTGLQALAMRTRAPDAGATMLLVRRGGCAVLAAAGTMLAAGVALPGQGSAAELLAGPIACAAAATTLARARALARHDLRGPVSRSPLADVRSLTGLALRVDPLAYPARLVVSTAILTGAVAYVWDSGDGGTARGALGVAGVEAAAVALCYLLLRSSLGLRADRATG